MRCNERLIDGVFEGGGAKGLAYIGALEVLESRGYWFKRIAGASAGSWIAALVACGYRALPDHPCSLTALLSLKPSVFQDGWLTLPQNFIKHGGFFAGRKLTAVLDDLLKKGLGVPPDAPSPTFADLKDIELHIIASCLTSREILVFNRQATPDLAIARAVRMSASLPLLYVPSQWPPSSFYRQLLGTSKQQLVVDGGVLSTFPMFIFKEHHPALPAQTEDDQTRPKLGFVLVEDEDPDLHPVEKFERKRRAKPVRCWSRGTAWLSLILFVLGYVHFLYQLLDTSFVQPILGDESLFTPLNIAAAGFPSLVRRTIYLIVNVLIFLPRLLVVFLPVIIAILAWNRPWRLLWQMTGLANIGFDKKHIHSEDVAEIFVGPYTTWRFNLSDDQRQDLIERGKDAVLKFLPKWEARHGNQFVQSSQIEVVNVNKREA
jgi:predicted acylesterase/phospholipase RssA